MVHEADGPPVVASVRDVCVRCLAAVWLSRITEEAMTPRRLVVGLGVGLVLLALGVAWGLALWAWLG